MSAVAHAVVVGVSDWWPVVIVSPAKNCSRDLLGERL
jgi:hypothetical protein